jgi:hypothetical protein
MGAFELGVIAAGEAVTVTGNVAAGLVQPLTTEEDE